VSDFVEEVVVPGAVALALIAALVAGLLALGNRMGERECYAKWQGAGTEAEYSFFGGCRVEVDGRLIPEERYINMREVR
jgi:hypothetical protein